MVRTPMEALERDLKDLEYAKFFGAAKAKAEVAVTISNVRHMLSMTQKDLAVKLDVSQPYIAKLEGGEANPTIGVIGSMLAALGLCIVMHTRPLAPSQRTVSPSIPNISGVEYDVVREGEQVLHNYKSTCVSDGSNIVDDKGIDSSSINNQVAGGV